MKKTLAIALGGVTVVGLGLFAYLKLRKQLKKLTSDTKSPILPQTPAVATTAPPLVSGLDSVISSSEKQEKENLAKALIEQALSRPSGLNDVQAVAYVVDYPEVTKAYNLKKATSQPFGSAFAPKDAKYLVDQAKYQAFISKDPLDFVKEYWKEKGRPAGHKIRIIKNADETPIVLNDSQATIYLAIYPDLRKYMKGGKSLYLDDAKKHWVEHGRSEGRRIDLM